MSMLLRRHRDRRSRSPRVNRRASRKFIPDSDSEFASTARNFAQAVADDPGVYRLALRDAEIIGEKVAAFRSALAKALHRFTRTERSVMEKDEARRRAEEVVRRYGAVIRANPDVSDIDKQRVRIRSRPKRLRRASCPQTAPYLRFVGAYEDGGPGRVRHVLQYNDEHGSSTRAKPHGSVRLELFVEWVPHGERIPATPDEMYGRPWYLRSFTRSRFEVEVPVPPVSMLIVYWGRWADSRGNVGPWSKTVVARAEGWSAAAEAPRFAADGAGRALSAGSCEARREIRSDARFFLAQREVRERYVEGSGALPSAESLCEIEGARPARLLDTA